MAKKVYLIKDEETLKNTGKLIEITGVEFYELMNSLNGEKRYFISLKDDIDYDCSEILIETSKTEYAKWQKEYDRHRYLRHQKDEFELYENLEDQYGMGTLLGETKEEAYNPEAAYCKKEEYHRLKMVLSMLEPAERELINRLYLDENTYTERELAQLYGVCKSAIHNRKIKILEKMKKSW